MKHMVVVCLLFAGALFTPAPVGADAASDMLSRMNAKRNPQSIENPELDGKIEAMKKEKDIEGLRGLIPNPNSAETMRAALSGTKDDTETIVKAGAALFELEDYDWLMQNVIHIGEDSRETGYKVLKAAGEGAVAALVEYLPKADFSFEHAGYAMDKIVTFFDDQDAFPAQGTLFARFVDPAQGEGVRHAAALAVGKSGIVAAEPGVRSLLASDDPQVRLRAAWVLGQLGQKASLEALNTVAANDPAFELVEKDGFAWKDYYVRAEAQESVQKITVKG